MKTKLIFSATAAYAFTLPVFFSPTSASTFTVPVLFAQTSAQINTPQKDVTRETASRRESLGHVAKASELIGLEVKNVQDEKLGKVIDLGVDTRSGRVVQMLVASGGVLGIGDKMMAVPPFSFRTDTTDKALLLDVEKEKFKAAPTFDLSKWEECCATQRLVEVYTYYHEDPQFVEIFITINGRVTLRGSVSSDEERRHLGDIAARLAEPDKVDNQLEVRRESATN